ncbi:MAG: YeeE/YedE family protein [Burkholderiales bacterium]|nr:YeeE/YedE family protein [Burkholderiales bacterium]
MFPITGNAALILAVLFGAAFGWLLHRGRLLDYDVIINQFRFRDFTVLKVMFTAIVVGGIGVLVLVNLGAAKFHVRDANMLGTIIGAAIFGVGMVLYGYCPGTGVAAIATGKIHALVGAAGMLFGAMLYAVSFAWVNSHILSVWKLGKVTLSGVTGLPQGLLLALLAAAAIAVFVAIERSGVEQR